MGKRHLRGKKKRRRRSRKMPEAVKQELAENKAKKNTDKDDGYMEQFRKSQKAVAESSRHAERRIQKLRCDYFRDKYPGVWREVMEGYRAEAEGEV